MKGGLDRVNLVEHYIVEIHSVEKIKREPWMEEQFVKVDVTIDCYGNVKRCIAYYPSSYWEDIKENGYYMG